MVHIHLTPNNQSTIVEITTFKATCSDYITDLYLLLNAPPPTLLTTPLPPGGMYTDTTPPPSTREGVDGRAEEVGVCHNTSRLLWARPTCE